MGQKNALTYLLVTVGVFLSIVVGISTITNVTGGIAGVSKIITFGCAITGLISPRSGLYALAVQAIYTDQLKRVGVYYGLESMQTIQEILLGPLITIIAINLGFLAQVFFGMAKLTKLGILLFGIAPLLGLYYLTGGAIGGGDSFMKRAYNGSVAGLYTTVIPLSYFLFKNLNGWIKFISFQTLLVVPSALWAIWQYFHGFSDMEWAYARSGLSPVHTAQMLEFQNPRVFGFFGSASALGCLCVYFAVAAWRTYAIKEWRLVFFLCSLILFAGLVVSHQRGALLLPFLMLPIVLCTLSKFRTILMYASLATLFLLGVWNSTWLLEEGLDKANAAIASNSEWGQEVLVVSTFSDRLRGWERLKRPSSWSLFGTDENKGSGFDGGGQYSDDYSHDMINKMLMKIGAVGIAIILLVAGSVAYILHKTVWYLPKGELRRAGAFSLGATIPIVLSSAAGGDNFSATPYNLAIWSLFAGVFVLVKLQNNAKELTATIVCSLLLLSLTVKPIMQVVTNPLHAIVCI